MAGTPRRPRTNYEFGTKYFKGGEPMTFLYHDDDPHKQKLRAELFFNNYVSIINDIYITYSWRVFV